MSLSELKKYSFRAKYANYNAKDKRRETWHECVGRSEQMMLDKYPNLDSEIIKKAYSAVKRKEILGSQRALQFAGIPIFRHEARLYNCTSSYCDRPRFFQECMYLLLCGCGTGFSVQKHHIAKLPNLQFNMVGSKTYQIPDTIEGWAEAIGILVNSYFVNGIYGDYEGLNVKFDYSLIRPAGAKLSYTTGKAPGPEPLKNAIAEIRKILDKALENKQEKLKPIQCYDIIMHASDAVLSGGVRRSATICLFSHDDEEMMSAKTGNWFTENPQRGRSNNSVVLLKGFTTQEEFDAIIEKVKHFGEPGFVWVENLEQLINPCAEISFWAYLVVDQKKYDASGYKNLPLIDVSPKDIGLESGWQFCNLSTVNGGKCDTAEKFYEAVEQAAIIGTLQAGYNKFPYVGEITEQIVKREALIGVSITGIMENPDILLSPKIQKKAAKLVVETNQKIAKLIGINPAARTTCVKPEGTASCVLGTSSGIHPHHAKRYFRRVQANKLEPLYHYFKELNPLACEDSVWSANDSDEVITFCIDVPDGAKTKNQLSAIEMLEHVKSTQQNWVMSGTTEHGTQPWLVHNVSNTISVSPDEWDLVKKYIYKNREYFCGISLLPAAGDKDYPQAPFCTIYTPKEMVGHYGDCAVFVSGLIERGFEIYDSNLWKACDVLLGLGEKPKGEAKFDWISKCHSFAKKYLNGDVRKLTYLMKDVNNWKTWLDLKRQYQEVDYDKFIEDADTVSINHTADSACSGNACSIIRT